MSDKELSEEEKIKLIRYVAELIKYETGSKRVYATTFTNAIQKKEGFTSEEIGNQTTLITKQIDDLGDLLRANEQKTLQIDKQLKVFQFANLVLLFVYFFILVGVKGLMLLQYLSSNVQRDEWVDTVMLTLLFVYPYIVYPIEAWIYEWIAWIVGLVYNTTTIPTSILDVGLNIPPYDDRVGE